MSVSLLSTILYIPPPRANAIERTRLTEKLLSGVNQPGSFTLLSGSAGFGKTTLLSEFIARLKRPVAWLSLDQGTTTRSAFGRTLSQPASRSWTV